MSGWWRSLRAGLRALRNKEQQSREMDEELQGFLAESAADKMRSGMSREEALRAARVEMGSAEMVKENVRAVGWEAMAENVWRDIRHSLRGLRKSPGFTLVAVLSLALGIGANTAIFTLVNQLMLRALPVHDPQQLVSMGPAIDDGIVDGLGPGPIDLFPYAFYQTLQKAQQPFFEGISAYSSFTGAVNVRKNGPAQQAEAELVSGNFFQVLGAAPLLGRTLTTADETAPGANPVAVVSYRYWQQKLGGDAGVVGSVLTLNRTQFTVVGVMPPQFFGVGLNPRATDLWAPLTMQPQVMLQPSLLGPDSLYWLHFMGRRRPGASLTAAQAWMTAQLRQMMLDREGAQASASRRQDIEHTSVELLPGAQGASRLRAQFREPLLILMGVVALVLLIACANLANFLLARASAREAETATRLALGATRAGIVRQVLTEALLLSLGGGLLGLGLAVGGTRVLVAMVTQGAAQTSLSALPDLRVLGFTFGLSLLTGVLFGLAPALRVSRMTVAPAMKANTRTVAGSGAGGSRLLPKLLVTAQVVLSLVLLAGAGLFVRTLRNLEQQDFGFHRDHLLLVRFNPKFAGYKPEQVNALYDELLSRIGVLPGVRSAAVAGNPPISPGSWGSPIYIQGRTPVPGKDDFSLLSRVSPDYFSTIGIPVLEGRPIERADGPGALHVAVVDETLAHDLFPKGDAIGHSFTVADPSVKGVFRIVGVARGAKFNSPREKPQRMIYLPVEQLTGDDAYAYWLQIRTSGDAAAMTGEVRRAMAAINPDLAMLQVRTIEEQLDDSMGNERLISQLSGLFSLLALGLACMGLYGVMTYNVVRRTNEIGIRLALGAQTQRVLGMVLGESLRMLVIGVAIGMPLTLALTRLVRSQLFGVSADDPLTMVTAVVVIAAVTLGAAWFPARRAMKVDPMVALRYE